MVECQGSRYPSECDDGAVGAVRTQIVFDAADPHALAAFWADALHYEHEEIDAFVRGLVESGRVPAEYTIEIGGKHRWWSVAVPGVPLGKQRSRTFATEREAERFLARQSADMQRGEFLDPRLARSRFQDWAEEWLRTTIHLKPKTQAGYESILCRRILPYFAGVPIGGVHQIDVRGFVAGLAQTAEEPGTVRNTFNVLRLVFATAVTSGAIRSNPCEGVWMPGRAAMRCCSSSRRNSSPSPMPSWRATGAGACRRVCRSQCRPDRCLTRGQERSRLEDARGPRVVGRRQGQARLWPHQDARHPQGRSACVSLRRRRVGVTLRPGPALTALPLSAWVRGLAFSLRGSGGAALDALPCA